MTNESRADEASVVIRIGAVVKRRRGRAGGGDEVEVEDVMWVR